MNTVVPVYVQMQQKKAFLGYPYYLRKLANWRGAFIRGGRLLAILAYGVGAYSGEGAYWSVGAYSRKYGIQLKN